MSRKLQITPAECRLRAAECHKMAQNARRPHVRDTLAEIERMWNRLAVEAEVSESMLTRFLEDTAFGPDEIAIMVMAYEMGLTQINASGDNDPTAETLAQTIVMLAKQGERDPVRLEQRAIEIISTQPPDLAGSHNPYGVPPSDVRRSDGGRTHRSTRAPMAKPASTSVVQCASITIRVAAMRPPSAHATRADFG